MNITDAGIAEYAADAEALIAPYDALDSARVLAPVIDLFDGPPLDILEIAAGTGRDAAWLAARGHRVVAVEPVAAFRDAARRLHPSPDVSWHDDRLPDLVRITGCYDRVLLVAVWQHLDPATRIRALARMAGLIAPGGYLALSLRDGPGAPARAVYEAPPEDTIAAAAQVGLTLDRRVTIDSVSETNRAAGVRWTWLALRAR